MAGYVITLIIFTAFVIYDANAQDINSLTPDASIKESDAEQIQLVINKIETPSMDGDVEPAPPLLDFNAPNYLELVYYRMTTALVQRVDRENFYCQEDLNAGIKPCRFKSIKPRDYYVNIFKAQWESEHPTTTGQALRAVKVVEPACPDGFEIYEGSGICNQFPSHVSAEQNYYHSALSTYQCGVALANVKDQVCVDLGDLADGANRGNLWKPVADDGASCSGGTTILLKESLANVTKIEIMNSNKERVDKPDYLGFFEGTRPRFCARRPGKDFGPYSIYIKYRTIDEDFCFKVNNPAKRED